MAIEDRTEAAIFKISRDYIYGKVSGHDKRFAPSVPEFASQCEMHDSSMDASARLLTKHPERREEALQMIRDVSGPEVYQDLMNRMARRQELTAIAGDAAGRDD